MSRKGAAKGTSGAADQDLESRLVFFGVNDLGRHVLAWLASRGVAPILQVTSRPSYSKIQAAQPLIGLSVGYRHILPEKVLALFPGGILNLHTSYLPYNRGMYPNVWPLLDGSPAGVTLHWIDKHVDTGPIVARRQCNVQPWDTAESLYHRLQDLGYHLFVETWPAIVKGHTEGVPQRALAGGSQHHSSELASVTFTDLDAPTTARTVLNVLRARTFPPHEGVRYVDDGHLVEARIELRRVEDS